MSAVDYLYLLRNHIDITHVPFSDRGSRLLLFQNTYQSSLYLKLAERLTQLESDIEAYLNRPPFLQQLFLIDEEGAPLEFKVISNPHLLTLATNAGDFEIVFQDLQTLAFGLPDHTVCGLRFHVFPQYWRTTSEGGKFVSVRDVYYNTDGEIELNRIVPVEGGYEVEIRVKTSQDCSITIGIHPTPVNAAPIIEFSSLKAAAENRWRAWFEKVPVVEPRYAATYAYAWWVMANNLISPRGKVIYEAMTPSKLGYVGLWLWDNAMHSLAYRHVDPELARNQIRAILACQLPIGMLPDAVFDEGIVSSIDHPIKGEVTKPPILAWAVCKLHETAPDLDFLDEVYGPLVRLNAWWVSMNDDDGDGLVQYNHPYSSGLDNSPLWDGGMPVESPDLNTYLCIQMEALAAIAAALHRDEEASMWRRRAQSQLDRMVEHFWDKKAGLFWALREHRPIKIVTPFSLYPLWTGLLPEAIRARLLAHLTDPAMFWGKYMLPTVARNDRKYKPESMWRGPVWANINYFFIEALQQNGETALARELREHTLALIMAHKDIYEYYNADTGEPPPQAVNVFGWTSAVFIDLAIQASRDVHLKKRQANDHR